MILVNGAAGFRCLGCHTSAEAALKEIPTKKPDVILMDIFLGGMSGIECVRRLKAIDPGLTIVMLTAYEDDELLFQALKAGANGYLVKPTSPAELLEAIAEVHRGGAPMSSNIARRVIESFHQTAKSSTESEMLSKREREVLGYLAKGYQYKEISEHLSISFDTVHTHIRNIYTKLQVRSKMEAVTKYLRIEPKI